MTQHHPHFIAPSLVTLWSNKQWRQTVIFPPHSHCFELPSVLEHCWFGNNEGTLPVKQTCSDYPFWWFQQLLVTTLSSLILSGHSLWSRNIVPYPTTRKESGCVLPVVSAAYITHFLDGLHYKWGGPPTYWSATTHTHHPYHRLKFFSHSACANPWTTVEPLGPLWPFAKGLEPLIRPPRHTWLDCWPQFSTTQQWSGNRLSSSTDHQSWSTLVGTATSITGQATWWRWWRGVFQHNVEQL